MKAKDMTEDMVAEEAANDSDIYSIEQQEELLDDGEIMAYEEAFMRGYGSA